MPHNMNMMIMTRLTTVRKGLLFLLILTLSSSSLQQGAAQAQETREVEVDVDSACTGTGSGAAAADAAADAGLELFPPRVGGLTVGGRGGSTSTTRHSLQDFFYSKPNITIRTAVITRAIPLAWREEEDVVTTTTTTTTMMGEGEGENGKEMSVTTTVTTTTPVFKGFQVDLLHHLERFALEDNVTLTFDIEEAPPYSYTSGMNRMANDCNTTENPVPWEECYTHDLWVGDIYALPGRLTRALFTPPIIETAATSIRYLNRQRKLRVFNTLEEATVNQEPVCVLDGSHFDKEVVLKYPTAVLKRCFSHEECITLLKQDECCLFVEDELQLRYLTKRDTSHTLQVTPEKFNNLRVVWPMSATLDPRISTLLTRWIYAAQVNGTLDALYDRYFSISFCPLGFAGLNCTSPCSSTHGTSNRAGVCVCDSTKWTGADCFTEVPEDMQLIPPTLLRVGYSLMGFNIVAVIICAIWLWFHRKAPQVQIGQPVFLCLVLLGCLISTSVIIVLSQQDDDDDQSYLEEATEDGYQDGITTTSSSSTATGIIRVDPSSRTACMAIPWLYSVGFCITFGTLFAKIRRVYLIFRAAADMRRLRVGNRETILVVAAVLFVDAIILTVWTIYDPLHWERTSLTVDKYGESLTSEGHCTSQYWGTFAMTIGIFHFALLGTACVMCYVSRNIPTRFSEGQNVSVAMVSNFQIFVVGIPLLILLGTDPVSSYFVRVVIVWMNDLVVLGLIFGNLMYSVHHQDPEGRSSRTIIRHAIKDYAESSRKNSRQASLNPSNNSDSGRADGIVIDGVNHGSFNNGNHGSFNRVVGGADVDIRATKDHQLEPPAENSEALQRLEPRRVSFMVRPPSEGLSGSSGPGGFSCNNSRELLMLKSDGTQERSSSTHLNHSSGSDSDDDVEISA